MKRKPVKGVKPGKLRGTRVYLGGNIENCNDAAAWRDRCTAVLGAVGVVCLNPLVDTFVGALKEDPELNAKLRKLRNQGKLGQVAAIMKRVVQKDLRMVDISDFLIFNLDADRPTWGTTHEIVQAAAQRKPIFIVIDSRKKTPLWLLRYVPEQYIFETHEKLLNHLIRINNGTIPFADARWKILLESYRCNC